MLPWQLFDVIRSTCILLHIRLFMNTCTYTCTCRCHQVVYKNLKNLIKIVLNVLGIYTTGV